MGRIFLLWENHPEVASRFRVCLFHHYVEKSVRDYSNKIAVKIDGVGATYRELDDIAIQVAR